MLGAAASAAVATADIAGIMTPEFFMRDRIIFIESLELDETQQVIVDALFDDYEQAFNAGLERMNEHMESIQDSVDDLSQSNPKEILEVVIPPIEEFRVERQMIGDQLIQNVQVILVPEQEALWLEFNNRLYIEKNATKGILSGENLNLYHITRDMALDPTTDEQIRDSMNAWALEAKEAMRSRDTLDQGSYATLIEQLLDSNSPEDIERKFKIIDARIRVREANDRGITLVAASMPEQHREPFMQQALKRAYPNAYNRRPAQRVLESAASNTTYSAELHDAIVQLLDEYLAKLNDVNTKILISTQTSEPERERERIRNIQRRTNGEETLKYVAPTKELVKQRKELGQEYIERLRSLLTPEQFNELEGSRRYSNPIHPNSPPRGGEGSPTLSPNGLTVDPGRTPEGKYKDKRGGSNPASNVKPRDKPKSKPSRD